MALANLKGRVAWIFDEPHFDVDLIVGVKNIKIQDIDELCDAAMQTFDPDFRSSVQPGDLLVGGENFGYGHPHYPPMKAMRHMGIAGIVAESFSPGYWRGEISMGFPQAPCPGILEIVSRWDEIEVDWAAGEVRNLTSGASRPLEALAKADMEMLEAGGITGYLKKSIAEADAPR